RPGRTAVAAAPARDRRRAGGRGGVPRGGRPRGHGGDLGVAARCGLTGDVGVARLAERAAVLRDPAGRDPAVVDGRRCRHRGCNGQGGVTTMSGYAFFTLDGDRYIPTRYARSAWTDTALNGPSVVAAAARALESGHGIEGFQPARLTVD